MNTTPMGNIGLLIFKCLSTAVKEALKTSFFIHGRKVLKDFFSMERTFKINQVMTINLHLTQFLPEMRIGEMSSKLGEIGKSTGAQLTYPVFFFDPDPDWRGRDFSYLLVPRSPSHRLIILLLFWWGC